MFMRSALLVVGMLAGGLLQAQSNDTSPAKILASRLVQTMQAERQLTEMMLDMTPPGDAREIARQLLQGDESLALSFESMLVELYEKAFTVEELRTLAEFFETEVGKKWASQGQAAYRELAVRVHSHSSFIFKVSEVGCASQVLGRAWADYKKRSGIQGVGVPTDFLAKAGPLVSSLKSTCGCVVRKMVEKWGAENLANIQNRPESEQFVKDTFESGACVLQIPKK